MSHEIGTNIKLNVYVPVSLFLFLKEHSNFTLLQLNCTISSKIGSNFPLMLIVSRIPSRINIWLTNCYHFQVGYIPSPIKNALI